MPSLPSSATHSHAGVALAQGTVPAPQPSDAPASRLRTAVTAFVRGPWFAYGMLLLLQARVVWRLWRYRDLSGGDTSSYYIEAMHWFRDFQINIAWSPLYTAFYGSFFFLTGDILTATVLHRLAIVFLSSALVLALLRRLLPAGLAWFGAAWWAVLPVNFNAVFEVHQFALLPVLVVWLILSARVAWARGTAVALLAASSVLVRNELSVAAGLLFLFCAVREWRAYRRREERPGAFWRRMGLAYGLPLILAGLLCYGAFERSYTRGPALTAGLRLKHTLNMAQVYTWGYQQRHPEWQGNAWTDYAGLMTSTFGKELPTLSEMVRRNPGATLRHFLWNWQLAPSGLQMLLFGRTSGTQSPDYGPVPSGSRLALGLSVGVGVVWLAGLVALLRRRRFWWETWVRPRLFVWLGLLAVVAVAVPVITTQRPRPSYLFSVTVFLIAVTGLCVFMVTYRWRRLRELARAWQPLLMAAAVCVAPPYFQPVAAGPQRPFADEVRRLQPYADLLAEPGPTALLADRPWEIRCYVARNREGGLDYSAMYAQWPAGVALEQFLDERQVKLAYFNEGMIHDLETTRPDAVETFLHHGPPVGWEELARGDAPDDRWRVFRRDLTIRTAAAPASPATPGALP